MTDIFALSDEAVDLLAKADPVGATYQGVQGYDHLWPNYSPDGRQAQADVWSDLAQRAAGCEPSDDRESLAKAVLVDECAVAALCPKPKTLCTDSTTSSPRIRICG